MCVSVFLRRYVHGVSVIMHTLLIMRHNRATRLPSFIKIASNVNVAVQGLCVRVCVLSHVTLETPAFVCTSCRSDDWVPQRYCDRLTIQVHSMKLSWRKHIIYTLARRNWAWDAHTALRPQMDAALSLREPRPAFGLSFALPPCTCGYLQVLCGHVSCWDAKIGHLLRDRADRLPGSSHSLQCI